MKPLRSITLLALAVLLFMVASLPFVLRGSTNAIRSMFNGPIYWISPDFEALQDFHAFIAQFDMHEAILISWPGCTVDDLRLHEFAKEIDRLIFLRRQAGEESLILGAPNGYDLVRDLSESQDELSRKSALARLRGVLVGSDAETSCAVIELTREGALKREQALAIIMQAADATVSLPHDQYRLAGPAIDGLAIDRLSIESLESFALPSALLSLLLCWICLRSLWFTLPLVSVAAFTQGVVLAYVYYTGGSMNAVLIVLPPLVFVLAISAGVHLVHYFYEEQRSGNDLDPTMAAIRKGWLPTTLAAATTSIGLASLLVSDVGPVRQFGTLGPIGVILSSLLTLMLMPGAMQWWPWRRQSSSAGRSPHSEPDASQPLKHRKNGDRYRLRSVTGARFPAERQHAVLSLRAVARQDSWDWLGRVVQGMKGWIILTTVLVLILFGYGLTRVTTTLNVVSLLDNDTKAVQDYYWFQDNIGPLVTIEVVLPFDIDSSLDVLQRAELVWRVHAELMQVDQVGGAISAATFMPPIPRGRGIGAIARRSAYRTRLTNQLDTLRDAGYLREDGDQQLWRVSGRVQGNRDIDYGVFLTELRQRIDPVVDELSESETVSVRYTGVTPVVYEVQRSLLRDLFSSFVMAIGLVGLVMILLLRSVLAGLIAMIPNVFPTVVLFGTMGWMGWAVDIGSVMTASVALGIAVDGTFHFLGAFFRLRRAGKDPLFAAQQTYKHCGRALVQTSLICAAGMLVFTNSSFLPARSFSWMLLLLLLIAVIGDLIVLPALLLGPTGRFFKASQLAPMKDHHA